MSQLLGGFIGPRGCYHTSCSFVFFVGPGRARLKTRCPTLLSSLSLIMNVLLDEDEWGVWGRGREREGRSGEMRLSSAKMIVVPSAMNLFRCWLKKEQHVFSSGKMAFIQMTAVHCVSVNNQIKWFPENIIPRPINSPPWHLKSIILYLWGFFLCC